jgi:hypothetical protein
MLFDCHGVGSASHGQDSSVPMPSGMNMDGTNMGTTQMAADAIEQAEIESGTGNPFNGSSVCEHEACSQAVRAYSLNASHFRSSSLIAIAIHFSPLFNPLLNFHPSSFESPPESPPIDRFGTLRI